MYREDVDERTRTTVATLYADDNEEELFSPTEDLVDNMCPMKDNLTRCDIYLCRIIRNILALPFPACHRYQHSKK